MNYHWNWGIFFQPNPMGTGTYLDMLLSGLVLTLKTALLAWIIALITGTIVGVLRTLPSKVASWFGFRWLNTLGLLLIGAGLWLWSRRKARWVCPSCTLASPAVSGA